MKELHNKDEYSTQMKPEGGLQASLCSNNVLSCSSPLGFTNPLSEEDALEYLAEIYIDIYLNHIKNNNHAS